MARETKSQRRERILTELLRIVDAQSPYAHLRGCAYDYESDHVQADSLLLYLIDDQAIKDAYEQIRKYYA